jgi:hypothetical protein
MAHAGCVGRLTGTSGRSVHNPAGRRLERERGGEASRSAGKVVA